MADRRSCINRLDHLGPPLQAHLACCGGAGYLADTGNFVVEGVERPDMLPLFIRNEKTCQITVFVVAANHVVTIVGCIAAVRQLLPSSHHSTAINAAAGGRSSASRTL